MQRHLAAPGRLVQLFFQHCQRQPCGMDRRPEPGPHFRNRAEMILVRMGENDAKQVLPLRFDEAQIGKHDVHAGFAVVRKGDAEIDHQPLAAARRAEAIEIDIHADLAHPAEGKEDQLIIFASEFHMPPTARTGNFGPGSRATEINQDRDRSRLLIMNQPPGRSTHRPR
jgi:hypothetical protein